MVIPLQTATDLKEIISTNDATIVGILIAVVVVESFVIIYLYKNIQSLNEKFLTELRENSKVLIELTKSNHEFINNIVQLRNTK